MLLLKAGALEHVSSVSIQFSWAVLMSPGYVQGLGPRASCSRHDL